MSRLPTHVEVGGILRRASYAGDFATVLKRGDEERGSLLLVVTSRGRHVAMLERILAVNGEYSWQAIRPTESESSDNVGISVAKRIRFDEDLWAIELDIAEPERFIAETIESA